MSIERWKETIIRLLPTDLAYLAASIALAVVLWAFLHFEQAVQVNVPLDIRWSGVPAEQMVLAGDMPPVRVVLDGPGSLLRQIENRTLVYEINADDLVEGNNLIRIDVARLKLPRGVVATRVSPSSFEVEFVKVEERVLPVKIIFHGNPPEGYRLGKISRKPATVKIRAREGQLDGAQYLFTRSLNLTGHNESFSENVGIDLTGLDVKEISRQDVVVDVEIRQENAEKMYENVPVVLQGAAARLVETIPEQVSVTLFGPLARLIALEGQLEARAVVEAVPAKPTPIEVEINLPKEVTLVSLMPRLVSVAARSRP